MICPGDEDWFRIALNQDQRVTASLQFDHQYGDLDMEFVDGDGKRILSAASEGSTESLSFTAETSAPIYVRVFGHEGASNAYVMTVSIETVDSGSCTEDLFGSHTSPEEAIVAYIGYYRELVSCAGQPDWFAVDLNGGETFDVIAQQPNNDSVLTVDIFKPGEENPVATGVSDSSGLARASYVLTGPSRLLYRISSLGSVDYALLTQVTDPIGEQCSEDRYEPNDDPENAHPLEPGVHTWLRLCGNEQDVFSVNLEAFDRLIAVTSHSDGLGYGDLEIRGPDGQELVAQAVGGEHGGVVEALADAPGVYTITVVGFGVSEALPYDIAIFLE